jgi:hypothetical protein
MTRRNAFVALLSIPLGAFAFKDAHANPANPAALRICLDDWSGFKVEYKGESVFISSKVIFDTLVAQDYRKNTSLK